MRTRLATAVRTRFVQAVGVVAILAPAAAHAQSIPATLGWFQIPNTQLSTVCAATHGFPEVTGNTGCDAITSAWSGGAFDTARNRLIIWGGGHHDYGGNEVYALDLNTLTMTRLNDPSSPIRDGCTNGGTYADGKPVARHTYNHLTYLPRQDALFAWGGAEWSCGNFLADTWLFSFARLTWTNKATAPLSANFGRAAAYDPNTDLIYMRDDFDLYSYSPATDTWTVRDTVSVGMNDNKSAVIDPVRRKYFLHVSGDTTLYWYDISSPTGRTTLQSGPTTGCGGFIDDYGAGWEYDPVQNLLVGWNGGNNVYLLNPDTRSCSIVTYPGGPTSLSNGTFGRFRYSPVLNVFVVCNAVSANCHTLRLTTRQSTSPASPTGLRLQ
jgi:hypothetical protein